MAHVESGVRRPLVAGWHRIINHAAPDRGVPTRNFHERLAEQHAGAGGDELQRHGVVFHLRRSHLHLRAAQ